LKKKIKIKIEYGNNCIIDFKDELTENYQKKDNENNYNDKKE